MGQGTFRNIILIGFSFTGKSVVGKEVARRLGWRFVDTDDEIVSLAGKPIPDIFSQDGENRFRELEHRVLARSCAGENAVISTGGGAILDPGNRETMFKSGVVVCLEASPQTIYCRLLAEAQSPSSPVIRPLLATDDPLKRIQSLKQFRQPFYALADVTVDTDNLSPDEVVEEVLRKWRDVRRTPGDIPQPHLRAREAESPYCAESGAALVVNTPSRSYPVFIGWGILSELGNRLRQVGLSDTAYVIGDSTVFFIYGSKVEKALRQAGFKAVSFTVPPGETTKTLETASHIYDWLVERRAERNHVILSLGGGMVGDLSGFVAATFLRGLPLVHLPTSLLAMVDASIGGKVAINHPQGKNLIGAFHQPRMVLADVQTLTTLPPRELVSGFAEVIKHAAILDAELFDMLEQNAGALLSLAPELTTRVIVRSAVLKAGIVSEDETEQGRRIILNFGHTIGHGLEAATGYGQLLHGEAVAIGMIGETMIAQRLGLIGKDVVERLKTLVQRFDLPIRCPGIDLTAVLRAMELDKKITASRIRWVLLKDMGQTIIKEDVPPGLVKEVLAELAKGA